MQHGLHLARVQGSPALRGRQGKQCGRGADNVSCVCVVLGGGGVRGGVGGCCTDDQHRTVQVGPTARTRAAWGTSSRDHGDGVVGGRGCHPLGAGTPVAFWHAPNVGLEGRGPAPEPGRVVGECTAWPGGLGAACLVRPCLCAAAAPAASGAADGLPPALGACPRIGGAAEHVYCLPSVCALP